MFEQYAVTDKITGIIIEEFSSILKAVRWIEGYQTPWNVEIIDTHTGKKYDTIGRAK